MPDKKIMAGGAVLAAAGFWFYVKPNYIDSSPPVVYTEEQISEAPRPTVTLEERVLNLKAPAIAPNYVKAEIALEFADADHKWIGLEGEGLLHANEEFAHHMEGDIHRIWDAITDVMGGKTLDEVATTEGREQLKAELREAINHELHHQQVENVFFVTFVTQ
ncbi:MAG: flagellar basal body-associated FliL family protein [Dehalococcoidia bacterium]|nr:flagellar basal body-associated FliL family protein [Dehalococcoidia bacterium]MCA9845719.1 flagellar basal body-associated FliL family protein [Dehalococcoidia bacterium]MCA9854551.1 flagellar basal body-associated FliL family protein [Dehalococcoidia bacterium]